MVLSKTATQVTISLNDTSSRINPVSTVKAEIKRKRPCCIRGYTIHSIKLKCFPRISKLPEKSPSLTVLKSYYKKTVDPPRIFQSVWSGTV